MWWSRLFAAVLLATGLGGCGFQSLYGTSGDSTSAVGVENELAQVQIMPIPDRRGQILRNHLLDLFNPKARPGKPLYRLQVRMRVTERKLDVNAASFATRANMEVAASFSLSAKDGVGGRDIPAESDEEATREEIEAHRAGLLVSGKRVVNAGFSFYDSEFATIKARQDAEGRIMRELAREIQAQVAVFFAQRRKDEAR